MVKILNFLLKSTRKPIRSHLKGTFIDSLRLSVQGGHGGNGIPKYGGVGGQGGCVYFVAKEGVTLKGLSKSLRDKKIKASSGEDSSKIRILGRRGMDQKIEVPVGVQIIDDKGKVLSDLNEDGSTCIAAGGGMGGCTGTGFIGRPGQMRTVNLDLKLIADVGLVGFPNAGKSTLLKALSNAKPKIATYPFTTIRPQIGIVEYSDLRTISIADLPGLIEGAHANFGMGHKFLKHIERTRLLLMIVDVFGFQLSPQHKKRNLLENIYALNKELELYDETLLKKPCVLLVNKMDIGEATKTLEIYQPTLVNLHKGLQDCPEEIRPEKLINFERIIPISALNSARINQVRDSLRDILDELAERDLPVDPVRKELQKKLGERGPRVT